MSRSRPTGKGLVHVRRSIKREETGIYTQLDWAIREATKLGVQLDAHRDDLDHMVKNGLTSFKAIRLDDGITGSNLCRPGLQDLIQDCVTNRSISHVFVHMPDRLARPEFPEDGLAIENRLRSAGLTLVFSNRVLAPRRRGRRDIGETLAAFLEYDKSGRYVDDLAVRIIEKQRELALLGHWTGGRAPYGFKRVRVFADGAEEDLADGKIVKSPGSHTELRIADPQKIKNWLKMLDLCNRFGWGAKRIAHELNAHGVPSPDAGRHRTENGIKHAVSGHWSASTVRSLLNNTAIIGMLRYGVQSEGEWRRLGSEGPRLLEDTDYNERDKPKVVRNPDDIVIRTRMQGVTPQATVEAFNACMKTLELRGKNQRGIPRGKDPAKYPLSTRVYHLECGWPMYGRTSGSRRLHVCGRYLNNQSCHHDAVDAEALELFLAGALRQVADLAGGREALVHRIRELASTEANKKPEDNEEELRVLSARCSTVQSELEVIRRNLARAKSDSEYDAIREQFHAKQQELVSLEHDIERGRKHSGGRDIEAEVEAALSILDNLDLILHDPEARLELRSLMKRANVNLWLHFEDGFKRTRPVRLLKSGLITTGNAPFPVRPYECGWANTSNDNCGEMFLPPGTAAGSLPADHKEPTEGISFRKVNRGD